MDANKEEGEISEDDDVKIIETSSPTRNHVKSPFNDGGKYPFKPCKKTDFGASKFVNTEPYEGGEKQTRPSSRYIGNNSYDRGHSNGRARQRRLVGNRYGLSLSVTRAREMVRRIPSYPPGGIPSLMFLKTSSPNVPRTLLAAPPQHNLTRPAIHNSSFPTKLLKPIRKTEWLKNQTAIYNVKSPSSDLDDVSYVDMLLEYKEIQKKLEVINVEECRLAEQEINNEKQSSPSAAGVSCLNDDDDVISIKSCDDDDDDDDLEELKLRRKCLESLTVVANKRENKSHPQQPIQMKMNRRFQTRLSSSFRRNKSPVYRRQSLTDFCQDANVLRLRMKRRRSSPFLRRRDEKRMKRNEEGRGGGGGGGEEKRMKRNEEGRGGGGGGGGEEKRSYEEDTTIEPFKRFIESRTTGGCCGIGKIESSIVGLTEDNYDQVEMDLESEDDQSSTEFYRESRCQLMRRKDDIKKNVETISEFHEISKDKVDEKLNESSVRDSKLFMSFLMLQRSNNDDRKDVETFDKKIGFEEVEIKKGIETRIETTIEDESNEEEAKRLRELLLLSLAEKQKKLNQETEKMAAINLEIIQNERVLDDNPALDSSASIIVNIPSKQIDINPQTQAVTNIHPQKTLNQHENPSLNSLLPPSTSLPSSSSSSAAKIMQIASSLLPLSDDVFTCISTSTKAPAILSSSKPGVGGKMLRITTTFKPPVKKSSINIIPYHQHKPVVISLNGESETDESRSEGDDDEATTSSLCRTVSYSSPAAAAGSSGQSAVFLGNLDNFLKEARKATEKPVSNDANRKEEKTEKFTSEISKNLLSALEEKKELEKQKKMNETDSSFPPPPLQQPQKKTTKDEELNEKTKHPLNPWSAADGRKVELKLLARKITQLVKDMKSERSELSLEQRMFAGTELEMARKKGQFRQCEIRVEKLKEQLSATQKIVSHNQQQITVLGKKTQDLRNQMTKRKMRLNELEKEMFEAERRLHSDQLKSKSHAVLPSKTTPGKKINCNEFSTHVEKLSSSSAVVAALLAREKKQLQDLAKKYEDMIEVYKRKRTSFKSNSSMTTPEKKKMNQEELGEVKRTVIIGKKCEYIRTEEKIEFKSTTLTESQTESSLSSEENQKEMIKMRRRRRSLIDQNPTTTKPKFAEDEKSSVATTTQAPCVDDERQVTSVKEKNIRSKTEDEDEERLEKIKLLSEGRLRQISRVYNDRMNKLKTDDNILTTNRELIVVNKDPFLRFQHYIKKILRPCDFNSSKKMKISSTDASLKPYHSSLLCFRSYRFSPFYRTKECLTIQSSFHNHRIDCNLPLCHFDLMGKCNDDKCPWQHEIDYTNNHKDTLVDIASYSPSLTGINENTPDNDYFKLISDYVDVFLKQNSMMTSSQQSLLLLTDVYKTSGLTIPNYIFMEPRRTRLTKKSQNITIDEKEKMTCRSVKNFSSRTVNEDNVIWEEDVRYWTFVSHELEDMETAVADNPNDVHLWLKLAYKKIADARRLNRDETLSVGLHVLSRGLEANQSSSLLWRHYLHLFSKRGNADELMTFYRQALNYAPSYYLFWKYLELSRSYSAKNEVCKNIRQFLCSPRCKENIETRSHYLLEIVLYQAGLNVETGRFKIGREILASVVKSKISVIWLNLTWIDRIIVWLCYVHLIEFKKLPSSLYNQADATPGRIVNKELFTLPWSSDVKPRLSYDELMNLLDNAIRSCSSSITEDKRKEDVEEEEEEAGNIVGWMCQLYRAKIQLEIHSDRFANANEFCQNLLLSFPQIQELWILLIDISKESNCDKEGIQQIICEALKNNPSSIHLHLAAISFHLPQDAEKALEFAERCPISFFNIDISAADPNLLFCKLLNQTLPYDYEAPLLANGVTWNSISSLQADIWLAYCFLLDLQGAHEQASEAYLTAISTIRKFSHLSRFCFQFLRRCYDRLVESFSSSNEKELSFDRLPSEFEGQVMRLLNILPSNLHLPFDREQSWINFSSHNRVIDFYVACLSHDDDILRVYEKFINMMPKNVMLVRRVCDFLVKRNFSALCNGYCTAALYETPKAMILWNIRLLLSHQDGSINLMRRIFQMATVHLPYSQKLWKDFLLFEILQKNVVAVKYILEKCREFEINLEDTLNALIPPT